MEAMRRLAQGDGKGSLMYRALCVFFASLLCAACASEVERPQTGVQCGALEASAVAVPLATYRTSTFSDMSATSGAAPISLIHPVQVVSAGDELFIADQGLGQLIRVQRSSQRFRSIARLPGRVSGMFMDSFRALYLAIPGSSAVLQLSAEGTTERIIRDAGSLSSPVDVVVDAQSRIHVADGSDARILIFDRLGLMVGALGERIGAANPFSTTNALAVGARGIHVLDTAARRIHIYSHGKPVESLDIESVTRSPSALAVDRWDRVFVLDHGPERVIVLQTSLQAEWKEVASLNLMQPAKDIWINDCGERFIAELGAVRVFSVRPPCAR